MPFDSSLPEELMDITKREEVIDLLQGMPIDPRQKKYIFYWWADKVDYKITADDIDRITGQRTDGTFP